MAKERKHRKAQGNTAQPQQQQGQQPGAPRYPEQGNANPDPVAAAEGRMTTPPPPTREDTDRSQGDA